ncbi:MAG TPA: T9SS type A sorting domain-containing protein, partial [Chitinophagales bacterium]|nr:T9SS type A sorting domain-containing protein [Chitinophagales bacterium]
TNNDIVDAQYTVFGLDGHKTSVNGTFDAASTTIDIADLPSGTYLIVINTISGVYSKTFVKI